MTTSLGATTFMSVVPRGGPRRPSDPGEAAGRHRAASAAAQRPPTAPELLAQDRGVAPGHHLPGGQARGRPQRGGQAEHPLPKLRGPDGTGAPRRQAPLGTAWQIWEFHDGPRRGGEARTRPRGHDACFMPRSCHVTGNVQGHEMAWVGDELWFVNTRFSCLCTLGESGSG